MFIESLFDYKRTFIKASFYNRRFLHGGRNGICEWCKPGVAGWRLKPARKGSGRPGWAGITKDPRPSRG